MKIDRDREAASRREFLRGGIRYALLAGVGAAAAAVGRARNPKAGETCVNQGLCRGCGIFDDCGLPQALSAKHALSQGSTP